MGTSLYNLVKEKGCLVWVVIIIILISVSASAQQTDTSKCVILIKNLKKCTTKYVRAYEVSKFNGQEWETVKYLNMKYKLIRKRRNRCIIFYESLM